MAKFRKLLKEIISREHSERFNLLLYLEREVVLRCRRFASGLASPAGERIRARESYGYENPTRALLAPEKALSTCVWVS